VRSAGRCLHATGRVVVGLCLGGAALGCLPRAQSLRQRLEAYDPRGRIHAAGAIAEAGAVDEVPALIDRLDDEDVAVRLAAISALETLTATRLGYTAWAPARRTSIRRGRLAELDGPPRGRAGIGSRGPAGGRIQQPQRCRGCRRARLIVAPAQGVCAQASHPLRRRGRGSGLALGPRRRYRHSRGHRVEDRAAAGKLTGEHDGRTGQER
jgi:hypothetical protein